MKFEFIQNPIAKMRHRHTRSGHTYDPQDIEKKSVKLLMTKQINKCLSSEEMKEVRQLEKAESLHAEFTFDLPIPKSDSESVKNLKRWGIIKAGVKPDLDNLEKFYLDCANEIIFSDDKIVVSCVKKKRYAPYDTPQVTMTIEPKKDLYSEDTKEVLKIFSPSRVRELMKAGYTLMRLPISSFEDCQNDDSKSMYAQDIANALVQFAEAFAADLTKVKNKCKHK